MDISVYGIRRSAVHVSDTRSGEAYQITIGDEGAEISFFLTRAQIESILKKMDDVDTLEKLTTEYKSRESRA